LHPYFRRRRLTHDGVAEVPALALMPGDRVLCSKGGCALWVSRMEGKTRLDFAVTDLPTLSNGKFLFEHFQPKQFIGLLPLMQFLRDLTETHGWGGQRIRASFMIDDLNLHSVRYGYVDCRKLVRHAREHNYHVSFATIPFDAWWISSAPAALFRENRDLISLLIHGNNHVKRELAQGMPQAQKVALAAEALRRIAKLESKAGVEVSRVIAPPHNACS
jgi:hypothetical protein